MASLVQPIASAARNSWNAVFRLWRSFAPEKPAKRDALLICLAAALAAWIASQTNLTAQWFRFVADHPEYLVDDLLVGALVLAAGGLVFSIRRANEAEQAATLLKDAFDSVSEGFVIYDRIDRLVLVNDSYLQLFPNRAKYMVTGARFEDLIRQLVAAGEFPEAIGHEEEWYVREWQRHREARGDVERQLADGRWILVSERRMRNGGIVGSRVDITEQKRVQEALRQSESRLRDFAEMTSDWFWEQDADLRFTWGSGIPALEELTKDRFLGRTRWEVADTPTEMERAHWATHKAGLGARRPFSDFRYRRTDASGRVRHMSTNGKPLFDQDGTFAGYRGTGNDVTERVETELELLKSRDASETASRAKSEFLATMSHELRTPLHAIIGFSELISDQTFGAINPKYVECGKDIRESGVHLLDLINEVLDLSMLDAGRYKIREERVVLVAVVDACVRMLDSTVQQKRVRLMRDSSLDPVIIQADRRAVRQIFLNLLDNALKFTEAGGVVSLAVKLPIGDRLEVTVADTGIGIDPTQLPHVFEPFYQVDATPSRRHGGAGLGLAICRKLLALHGGSIELESEVGRGTTATIGFPLGRVLHSVGRD